MKTVIQSWKNRQIKLVIDEPGVPASERAVLAVAELYEGLGVWTLADVRLREHGMAGPYFNVGADSYWASWTAPDIQSANEARSLLRETFPPKAGESELEIDWCTFDGIVRGRTPLEMGVAAHMQNPSPVLHTMKEVRALLRDMSEFWASWPHSERDPDIRKEASAVKIENPWRQLRCVRTELVLRHLRGEGAAEASLTSLAQPNGGSDESASADIQPQTISNRQRG